MTQIIKPKTGSGVPTTGDIVDREIAIDKAGQKLYINDNGIIKEIGGGGGASGDLNLDGGFANSTYTAAQLVDGGYA